ncbi:inositol monophosphatase [Patescibacteria group bacterium]|nr:inositol monophosphatase [Patescibacteria group bacterium]
MTHLADADVLEFTKQVARGAGEVLLEYWGGELTRQIKSGPQDFATEADLAAEKLIVEQLTKEFPDDDIVAEESGKHEVGKSPYTWLVDPLDGTWNFANDVDNFGVMIARAEGDTIVLGVVLNPKKRQLAWARRGSGAYLNNAKVLIESRTNFEAVKPVLEKMPALERAEQMIWLREQLLKDGLIKTYRSASENVLVALRLNQDLHFSTRPGQVWDFAATSLLRAEAGLKVTNFWNQPWLWRDDPGYLAAPEALHQHIFSYLDSAH